jgi:hypothetical protein
VQRQSELRISLSVNQTIVDAEGVEHYKRLRDFLKPLGIRNNVVMAYGLSAIYNLQDEMEVAPSQIGQSQPLANSPSPIFKRCSTKLKST